MKEECSTSSSSSQRYLKKIEALYQPCTNPQSVSREECLACAEHLEEALKIAIEYCFPEKQADILLKQCWCCIQNRDFSQAEILIKQFFAVDALPDNYPKMHMVYNFLGRVHWVKGDYQSAIDTYLIAFNLFQQAGMALEGAGMCMNISGLLSLMGKPEEALEWVERATIAFEGLGNNSMVMMANSTKANILMAMGKLDDAFQIKQACEMYFGECQNFRQQSVELNTLAVLSNQMNRIDLAIEYSHKAITLKEQMGDFSGLAHAWNNLGVIYKESGDSKNAEIYYLKALERFKQMNISSGMCMILNNLSNICKERNNNEEARQYLEQALPYTLESQDPQEIAAIKTNLGSLYCEMGINMDESLMLQQEACQMMLEAGNMYSYVEYGSSLASTYISLQRHQESLELLLSLLDLAKVNHYDRLMVYLFQKLDQTYFALGDKDQAREYLLQYFQAFKEFNSQDTLDKVTEMKTKYETEKREQEAEIYRLKNIELEEKNRLIEEQKNQLQDTLTKLQNSEIRYNFVSEELTRNIRSTMIGKSDSILHLTKLISMVAKSDKTNVLITGETGTGKEIVARNIHTCSSRSKLHFFAVNCSAVPESLFESQFFGHEKDAFTGASTAKIGWFEIADKSTLFLDEIGTLSLEHQAKLLRALEERVIVRVGSHREIPVNVRIISATNINLNDKVLAREFREDLYHRLAIFVINIPPLRERKEEIPLLVEHFTKLAATVQDKRISRIEKPVYDHLLGYHFPGNVRELKNMVERAVLVADSSTLRLENFIIPIEAATPASINEIIPLQDVERLMILRALKATGYNKAKAAKLLNVERKVVERKSSKFGITEEEVMGHK